MSTELNPQLALLVSAGASLTLPDGLCVGLADAMILNDGRLWYCAIWPRDEFAQHWLKFRTIDYSLRDNEISLTLDNETLAIIALLDDYERTKWNWQAWTQDEGQHAFVEHLRRMVLIRPALDA